MTLVTATVEDIVGAPDNTVWNFSSLLRQSDDGGEIITPRWSKHTPVAGVLALDLEPGFASVAYRGKEYVIEVPATGTADLWDLLAASAAFPPGTPPALVAQAIMGYLATHLDDTWDGLGATAAGRALVAAVDAAAQRGTLHAVGGSVRDATGTPITNKGVRFLLDSNGEIDDIIMEGI